MLFSNSQNSKGQVPSSAANLQPNHFRFPIIVHSHLSWDWVWQRPQQFLSRLSRRHRVLFVETHTDNPHLVCASAEARPAQDYPNLTILRLHLPPSSSQDRAWVDQESRRLVQAALAGPLAGAFERPVQWFYDPMAVTAFAGQLNERAIVYDCMDRLSQFRNAPPEIVEREKQLLARAAVVFAGGRKLHEAKSRHNRNCHYFNCGVDVEHFGRARDAKTPVPADLAALPKPVLGYFGVVDERMDYELLAQLAEANPAWSIAVIGPTAKVDEKMFPRRPNLHWLGGRPYADLPACAKAFELCLMPFALNEATEYINPTKALEYMATGREIVSTAVPDVVLNFGSIVRIADSAEGFINLCREALSQPNQRAVEAGLALANQNTWDSIVTRLEQLIAEALPTGKPANPPSTTPTVMADSPGPDRNGNNGHSAGNHNHRAQPFAGVPVIHPLKRFDYLIVGAGYAGSVLAERLARGCGKQVLLVDRRAHIGGNAYDHFNHDGLLVHKYGPHIFHTNSKEVFDYLSRFTTWRNYQHRVLAQVDGQLVPIPINLDTINLLYGTHLSAFEMEEFLAQRAEKLETTPRTSEEVVVSHVGRDLYVKLFRNYTRKAWGLDPSELDAQVTARVPTRTNRDSRYFTDTYQAMPRHGFTHMFGNMLDHPNIKLFLNVDYREITKAVSYEQLIYTGPIDEFYDYRFGKLPYRCLRFEHETLNQARFQPVAVVNYPNEYAFTRITEFKHLTGQEHPRTAIVYEYPEATGDEYYPIPRSENAQLYRKYQALADADPAVHFVGRLATYRYYNMDQVTAQALTLFKKISKLEDSTARVREVAAKTAVVRIGDSKRRGSLRSSKRAGADRV